MRSFRWRGIIVSIYCMYIYVYYGMHVAALKPFPLLFTPITRASQWLLLHRGNSQKTEHLRVIENKVLNPSQMHDIQSGGHTWLPADKTLSSSNSCSCIVAFMGDKKTLPMAFKSFQCSPILGELLTGGRERFALCVQARALTGGQSFLIFWGLGLLEFSFFS